VPNQVTLTFGGDPAGAQKAFGAVGDSAKKMQGDVDSSADGFARAGEAADGAEGKAQGFSDTLTGVADIGGGTAAIMKGNLFEGFVQVGQGGADLAGGLASFLIPALQKTRVASLASSAASKAAAFGTNVWNVAQKALTVSFWLSPIGIIVGLIALLVVAIVLIATKTDWFQRLWKVAWKGIKSAASNTWDFIKQIPGWIGTAFRKVSDFITAPFRAAFNGIARAWNNTVGRLSWSVPGWVPGIGGNSISVPNLPTFHSGGVIPGVRGTAVPFMGIAGERVSGLAGSGGGGAAMTVRAGDEFVQMALDLIAAAVRSRGGDPSVVGIRIA
jgi:hypothetical protein